MLVLRSIADWVRTSAIDIGCTRVLCQFVATLSSAAKEKINPLHKDTKRTTTTIWVPCALPMTCFPKYFTVCRRSNVILSDGLLYLMSQILRGWNKKVMPELALIHNFNQLCYQPSNGGEQESNIYTIRVLEIWCNPSIFCALTATTACWQLRGLAASTLGWLHKR